MVVCLIYPWHHQEATHGYPKGMVFTWNKPETKENNTRKERKSRNLCVSVPLAWWCHVSSGFCCFLCNIYYIYKHFNVGISHLQRPTSKSVAGFRMAPRVHLRQWATWAANSCGKRCKLNRLARRRRLQQYNRTATPLVIRRKITTSLQTKKTIKDICSDLRMWRFWWRTIMFLW